MGWDPVGDAAESYLARRKELLDDFDVAIGWLNDADGAPRIRDMAMTVLWRANIVVAESGTWNTHDMWAAADRWEKLRAADELPTEGHRDAWRYGGRRVCAEARRFADTARATTTLEPSSLDRLAAVAVDVAAELEQVAPAG
jgi:hypothetical protein